MNLHYCTTSDGMKVMCLCVRGVDHNEDEFDVPLIGGDDA